MELGRHWLHANPEEGRQRIFPHRSRDRPGTGLFGNRVSDRSFGHTGYTGTSIWVDPQLGTWAVLLANRTYDTEGNNRMQQLRRAVADYVVDAAAYGPRPQQSVGGGGN